MSGWVENDALSSVEPFSNGTLDSHEISLSASLLLLPSVYHFRLWDKDRDRKTAAL